MLQRFALSLLLSIALASTGWGSAIFYSDLASYNAAVAAAGITTNVINFESVPVGQYSTAAGLTVDGLQFVGPFGGGYFLAIFDEATWGSHFAPSTGNTLASIAEIDITLPPGTRAFGANVGESAVWATGLSSQVEFRLSTGESASTPVNPSRLFPFFGF